VLGLQDSTFVIHIVGGVERNTGRCFLVVVEKRNAETLIPLLKKFILPGTTVLSDCWAAYRRLNPEGFYHFTVSAILLDTLILFCLLHLLLQQTMVLLAHCDSCLLFVCLSLVVGSGENLIFFNFQLCKD
jgi:hypothetical protein